MFSVRQVSSSFTIDNILGRVSESRETVTYTDISDDDTEVNEEQSEDESIPENDETSNIRYTWLYLVESQSVSGSVK